MAFETARPPALLPTPTLKGRLRRSGREALRSLYLLPRLPSAHLKRRLLPSFVVVGAQKAGTTSLFRYLADHPVVQAPRFKEVHFFDLHWKKGPVWYRSHFPRIPGDRGRITGEASPYYLFHPRVPERMASVLPQAKILVLLRNPVDRALSHYHWEVGYGNERLSFREALERETEILPRETARILEDDGYRSFAHQHASYLARGRYAEQLRRWLDAFPREQILVLTAEDFFAKTAEAMTRAQRFLGLSEIGGRGYPVHRKGRYKRNVDIPREELADYFRPFNQELEELLKMGFSRWD